MNPYYLLLILIVAFSRLVIAQEVTVTTEVIPVTPPPTSEENQEETLEMSAPAEPDVFSVTSSSSDGSKRLRFPAVDHVLIDPPMPPHPAGTTPSSAGEPSGEYFVGHRAVIDKYSGWGWVRKQSESWRQSRWVVLMEKPGTIQAPGRYLAHPDQDHNTQYRLYGRFIEDLAYEPKKDTFVPIFELSGFEWIGPAPQPDAPLPTTMGKTRSKPTTGGARTNPFKR
ncbi:MAG: hypothetical protein ACFCUX_02255 [Candidatus Methylacidiphilales bacterium]